jgi:hypothetical protein
MRLSAGYSLFPEIRTNGQRLPELVRQEESFPDSKVPTRANSRSAHKREVFEWEFPARNKEIRACFIPDDPELVFINADYKNIELVIAAHFAREERMLEIFRRGGDVHTETASTVLGDPAARQEAKTVDFGCLYGGGWQRLQLTARTEFGLEFSMRSSGQISRSRLIRRVLRIGKDI